MISPWAFLIFAAFIALVAMGIALRERKLERDALRRMGWYEEHEEIHPW